MKKNKYKGIDDVSSNKTILATQLFEQGQYLIKTIYAANELQNSQKMDCISNAVIKFLKLVEAGEVDITYYDNFKDLFFSLIKQNVLNEHCKKEYSSNQIFNDYISLSPKDENDNNEDHFIFDIEDNINIEDETYTNQITILNNAITKLPIREQLVYKDIMAGKLSVDEILIKHNISKTFYYSIPNKLKEIIEYVPGIKIEEDIDNEIVNDWIDERLLKLRQNGMTYNEIAQLEGCSVHKIKWQISPEYRKKENKRKKLSRLNKK